MHSFTAIETYSPSATGGPNSCPDRRGEGCDGAVYSFTDVSKRAKVLEVPAAEYTDEARVYRIRGTVVVTAVFCRNGKITNIEVVRGLPHGLTEKAVESTRAMKFEPAQKDGQPVSQRFRRELSFDLY